MIIHKTAGYDQNSLESLDFRVHKYFEAVKRNGSPAICNRKWVLDLLVPFLSLSILYSISCSFVLLPSLCTCSNDCFGEDRSLYRVWVLGHDELHLKSCHVSSKQCALCPVKCDQHTISSGHLLDQVDQLPQDKGNTSKIGKEQNFANLNLRKLFTTAKIGQQTQV